MTATGQVLAVNALAYGDVLTSAATAGATTLTVEDAVDFAPDGGWLILNDTTLEYTAADYDTGIITLAGTLPAAAAEGDRVDVWDPETETVVTDVVAQVQLDGALGNDDAAEAVVTHALVGYLPEGIREENGETVTLERRGQTLYVTNIRSREASFDGQVVWNPFSSRTMNSTTISNDVWETITSWTEVETNAITTTSDSWIIDIDGWYFMDAQVAFEANGTGRRRIRVLVNGVETAYRVQPADDSAGFVTFVAASREFRLFKGDELKVQVRQNSGAALDLSSGASHNHFSMHRISV